MKSASDGAGAGVVPRRPTRTLMVNKFSNTDQDDKHQNLSILLITLVMQA